MMATEAYYDRLRDSREPECYRRSMIDFFFAHGENGTETLDGREDMLAGARAMAHGEDKGRPLMVAPGPGRLKQWIIEAIRTPPYGVGYCLCIESEEGVYHLTKGTNARGAQASHLNVN